MRVNAEQASKILMRKPTFGTEGRLPSLDVMTSEEPASDSAGVVATACMHTETWATREASAVEACDLQLAAREGQAGPYEVAERPVVPMKPGNAG